MTDKPLDETSTLLTRKTVYDGRTIRLELERVALPGGHVTELEIIHHPGASCVVPFVTETDILLIRQFRHAAGGFILEAPAGKLSGPDEKPEDCAARELEEETGWRPGRLEYLGTILTTPGFTDEKIHLYSAHDLERGTQQTEESEILTVKQVSLTEARAMIADGRITDAKTICALSMADAARSKD